ncbi:hypothetical protein CapIbe_014305 [Capra ibex]
MSKIRRGFRMGEGASALQEVKGKLTRLARASKPQITHFIQPKVEEMVQGDFPGLLALAGVVQTAASSRPLVLSDLQQPDHGQQWGCCVGVRLRSLLCLIAHGRRFLLKMIKETKGQRGYNRRHSPLNS